MRIYEVIVGGVATPIIHSTTPSDSATIPKNQHKPSNQRILIFTAIVSILILSLAYWFYSNMERQDSLVQQEEIKFIDKSIAVRPFTSLSEDPEKQYLADGVMDAILLHLSKIEDLRVISRTSVEQYRETIKTASNICQELDVSYLLEGSFQKHGDRARLIVQLIEPGKEGHVWANEYDRDWKDIFTVQSEVAQTIAKELQAVITPKEKQLIEKIPTANLTAYDFYQRGKDEHLRYQLDNTDREALERAEDLYHKALEYDSAFALAYTGLAEVYWNKHYWETFLTENFMDTVLVLADIALSFDDQLAEAYVIRGNYYRFNYEKEQAIVEYDQANKFNPNFGQAYAEKGRLYDQDDLVKAIDNFQKAASLQRGPFLPGIYRSIGNSYVMAGFREKFYYYIKEALKLDDDSAAYYKLLAELEDNIGNYKKAIEFGRKSYSIDSTDLRTIFLLGINHSYLGQNEEYLEYMKKYDKKLKTLDQLSPLNIFRIGHAYWVNGFKEEAEYYFNTGLEFHFEMIELGRHYLQDLHTFYNLGAIHTFLGDRDKAYENLRLLNQRQRMPLWMIANIKNDPLFDNIRGEPEFQQIVKDVEAKYQAEHERVRVWLEKEGML